MATYNLAFPDVAIDAILTTAYHLQQAGYIFRGSASDYSGTPTEREWVIAPAGFTGYGISSPVPQGSIGVCLYNGTAWVGKIINVATIDSTPTQNSGNAVSSGGAYAAINQLSANVTEALENLTFTDTTPSAFQDEYINMKVSTTEGGVEHILTYLTILAATTSKAGLLTAEDKQKIDSFLTNLRSLTFADTTASADQGTQITETLKATIGGVQEVIDSITILAATSSKAGLLSASDKAYIDALPAALTNLSNSISAALALMESLVGYYTCDTAAATAAKTVAATGYSLTNGGCIRIKMTNANTAANVTLNINSTGAKALYYDGAQASSTNTWEAGEVLEVYYDGTQYQCASGGGGKFATGEAVKDVSITDTLNDTSALIEAAPVKEAIDSANAAIEDNTESIDDLNEIIFPRESTHYGVLGVGSDNMYYSSVWFYFNYTVTSDQRIDSIILPSAYTGNVILAFADATTQKVIAYETYAVTNATTVVTNKQVPANSILGIGLPSSQIGKYGSTNEGTVKYVTASSIAVNAGLSGSYQRGDMNVQINISSPLPSLYTTVLEMESEMDDMQDDIEDINDVLFPSERTTYGVLGVGSSNLNVSQVWVYFKYTVLPDQRIDSITLPSAYTGDVILAFVDASTQKVVAYNTYTVTNATTVVTNKQVPANSILGLGFTTSQFLKYGSTNEGTVKYITASSIAVGAGLTGGYQRGDMNVQINISKVIPSLEERVETLEDDVVTIDGEIDDINDVLYPVQRTTYGVKGVGSDNLYYSSAWFYFDYTIGIGQVIESIELPSVYTGTFILAFANAGTQKVTEILTFDVSSSDVIIVNKTMEDSAILGFAASTSQILKRGSTNVGIVKYVSVSNLVVGAGLSGGYQYGDINLKVNISKTMPTIEERLEALEDESMGVTLPYGEVNVIPILGQSLSLGIERSIPAIHTTPILGGLMFSTGIYQVDSGLEQMTGIKNLAEGSSTIYEHPDYETSCWGTADAIKKRIIDKLGDNIETFYLTCGQNGSSIDEQFDSEVQVVERALTRVKALLPYKTVKMPCFCYIQGEADQAAGMATETYKSKLKAGREAIQEVAERVLGQTTPVQCILYQTIRGYYDHKTITQAHMELCRDEEHFAPSTSVYTLMDSPNGDRLHISNWGEFLLGQYQGIQFTDWIYFGRKNVGVMPLDITVSSNVVTIKFKVSYPPLRFVTDWVTAVDNYGFSIVHSGTNIIAQDGVVIVDADKVQITCTQNIQNGDMLYYGISLDTSSASAGEGGSHNRGNRGNLCDSQGDLYTTQVVNDADNQMTTVALNNYCYSFYEELSV